MLYGAAGQRILYAVSLTVVKVDYSSLSSMVKDDKERVAGY